MYSVPEELIAEKKWKSRFSDKKQLEKYIKILGKEIPQTLEEFQDIKYNDTKKWEKIKLYSKVVQFGEISPLVGYKHFEKYRAGLEKTLIGLKTKDGLEIKGLGTHFVARAIGTHEWLGQKKMNIDLGRPFDHKHVSTEDITNCITQGELVRRTPKSITYKIVDSCMVSINLFTGLLIQCNSI